MTYLSGPAPYWPDSVIVENEHWGNWADGLLEQAVEERKERKRRITTLLNVSRFIDFFLVVLTANAPQKMLYVLQKNPSLVITN